jgi:hypothetical protein
MKNKRGVAQAVVLILVLALVGYLVYVSTTNQTASLTPTPSSSQPLTLSCYLGTPTGATASMNAAANTSFVADPNDRTHYTITLNNATNDGSGSINGTVTCNVNNPSQFAGAVNCAVFSGSFKNAGSTSDQNLYYILATSSTKSLVSGMNYQQTAYLKDGSVATTSDNQEVIPLAIANGKSTPTVQKIVGYYLTLTTAAQLNYITNQNSVDSYIKCDTRGSGAYDTTIARLTFTKVSS